MTCSSRPSRRPLLRSRFLLLAAAMTLAAASPARADQAPSCGNGIVEDGEQCDPGSPVGSRDCSPLCRSIDLEPPGLPFAPPLAAAGGDAGANLEYILSPRLECAPFDVRDGYRDLGPAHVRYRIHLCRTTSGKDAFTPTQVRAVLAEAATEFAQAGIVLEEESLVRFTDSDCDMPLGDSSWSDALVADTPPGVLAVAFVSGITNPASHYGVAGYCNFFGPFCVNAGAYDTLVVHELGHFFGLAHTFECAWGIETPDNCEDAGDLMCDTPPDRGPLGVSGIAECNGTTLVDGTCSGTCAHKTCTDGSEPDGYNWMSYYDCVPGRFSNEQRDFMRCTLDHEMISYNADAGARSTTTTTLPAMVCGDMNGDGKLTASDALGVLRAGVGVSSCATWTCDFDGSGLVSASDALGVLRSAVGELAVAKCPPES